MRCLPLPAIEFAFPAFPTRLLVRGCLLPRLLATMFLERELDLVSDFAGWLLSLLTAKELFLAVVVSSFGGGL